MWDLIVSVPDHCLSFYFVLCEHPYSFVSYNILKLYLSFLELGKVLIKKKKKKKKNKLYQLFVI